jgi:hypothetical protein
MARISLATSGKSSRLGSSRASASARSRTPRKPKQPKRIDIRNPASRVRETPCLARMPRERTRADRTRDVRARKVPSITISGAWLRSAGFAPGKPCFVRAFAYLQLVIYQP